MTIHKAQGSEFELVVLVLPNPCRMLSRELLYTALTRQKQRVVILHQGDRTDLKRFASDSHSESATRLTNLFVPPRPVEVKGKFYEEGLIHRTMREEFVRSKSEVVIANILHGAGIHYEYEKELRLGGELRFPDFTIEDHESGRVFYWEHCGMLGNPVYAERWRRKLDWYRANEVYPCGEKNGSNGVLIITEDDENGGIDSSRIARLVRDIVSG